MAHKRHPSFSRTPRGPVVSSGRTMARKCVKRKRSLCTVETPLESRFWTRSTAKAWNRAGKAEAQNVESGESRVSTLAT